MKRFLLVSLLFLYGVTYSYAEDWHQEQRKKDVARAKYWKEQGYNFSSNSMSAWTMDQKVKDIKNASKLKRTRHDTTPLIATTLDNQFPTSQFTSKYTESNRSFVQPSGMIQTTPKMYYNKEILDTRVMGVYAELLNNHENITSDYVGKTSNTTYNDRFLQLLQKQLELYSSSHKEQSEGGTFSGNVENSFKEYNFQPPLGKKTHRGTYLGQWSANEFAPNSTSNQFGAGNPFNANSINNSYGKYGNKFSPYSSKNPYSTSSPKLYDSQGNYRGRLSSNPYDPDSISNPYGRYGNKFSSDSINNKFGAGNPFSSDSPFNSFGNGLSIYGDD